MKKITKILTLVLLAVCGLVLVACKKTTTTTTKKPTSATTTTSGKKSSTTTVTQSETRLDVDAKTEVKAVADTREAVYGVFNGEGTQQGDSYKSLYEAINVCVDEGGETEEDLWFVALVSDKDTPLFVNYIRYAEDSADMFWYYEDGVSLNQYDCWRADYWPAAKNVIKKSISVFKSGEGAGLTHYTNSWDLVAVGADPAASNTAVWNSCWKLESSIVVDAAPYSGITKNEYTVELSKALIVPPMDDLSNTYAYVGFITADAYNVSHMGLACDTRTGNWYYYSGEVEYNTNNIEIDTDTCYLTSTWDEEAQGFRPDGDVNYTCQLVTEVDADDTEYIVHRLVMDFGNDRVVTKDYEISALTDCGTIRFTAGLDIQMTEDSGMTIADYMNGSEFKNLTVTRAMGYCIEGQPYNNVEKLPYGDYDRLNSNPMNESRYHTIVYNTATVEYDFGTPGKDVYSFSYKLAPKAPISETITSVVEGIEALEVETLAAEDAETVIALRDKYTALTAYQKGYVSSALVEKLVACEDKLIELGAISSEVIGVTVTYNVGDATETVVAAKKVGDAWVASGALAQWKTVSIQVASVSGSPKTIKNTDASYTFTGAFGVYAVGTLYVDGGWGDSKWGTATAGNYAIVFEPSSKTFTATFLADKSFDNNGVYEITAVANETPVVVGTDGDKAVVLAELEEGQTVVFTAHYIGGYPHAAEKETFTVTADRDGWYYCELDKVALEVSSDYSETEPERTISKVVLIHTSNTDALVKTVDFVNNKAVISGLGGFHAINVEVVYSLGAPLKLAHTAFTVPAELTGAWNSPNKLYVDDTKGNQWTAGQNSDGTMAYVLTFDPETLTITVSERVIQGYELVHKDNSLAVVETVTFEEGSATHAVAVGAFHRFQVFAVYGEDDKELIPYATYQVPAGLLSAWNGDGIYQDDAVGYDLIWTTGQTNSKEAGSYVFTITDGVVSIGLQE